jgi:cytochrome c biogenesis protein CcmG/thiol:disulfide interchange protein DsbE
MSAQAEPSAPPPRQPRALDPTLASHLRRGALLLVVGAGLLTWIGSLQGNRALEAGRELGEVRAELGDGKRFVLADHRGEVVVLSFWATWCIPCRHEAPLLSRLHREGTTVIGLAVDDLPTEAIAAKARELGMSYPVGKGAPGLVERLHIDSVPTTCVIGKDGAVVLAQSGVGPEDELRRAVAGAKRR